MFIGHFGIGFGAKKLSSTLSLGTLFIASLLPDLIWSVLLLFKIENSWVYNPSPLTLVFPNRPFSHSLITNILWSILAGGIYFIIKKNKRDSLILSLLICSHWILDYVSNYRDIALSPWANTKVGLGLRTHTLLLAVLEGAMFLVGAYFYEISTIYKNNKGKYYLPLLFLLLIIINVFLLLGPTLFSEFALNWQPLLLWYSIYLAYVVDKNRQLNIAKLAPYKI